MTVGTSTVVGALACQRNSFLKTFKTTVKSSGEYKHIPTGRDKQNKNRKKADRDEPPKYAIVLQDTILFPEGGGQPFDKGTITLMDSKVVQVESVLRDKLTAVHITNEPVEEGAEVTLEVDWKRRLDHMQQHTGQHLLSAVFDTYKLDTLSWSMGETLNYIELPQKVDDSVVEEVSEKVNDLILQSIPINVATPDSHGEEVDTSHIPDDYDLSKGIVRIVKIDGVDANPCCGTHLSNTSQIQAITLLHQVSIRGGNSRLFFICGARVPKYLRKSYDILKNVSGSQLSCQIEEVADKVAALNSNYRSSTSRESALLKEIAAGEANTVLKKLESGSPVAVVYRQDPNPEYLLTVQKELTTLINKTNTEVTLDNHTLVLLNGASGTGGMIKIVGPKAGEISNELKALIKSLKGGGKGSFQGKVAKYEKGELNSSLEYLQGL